MNDPIGSLTVGIPVPVQPGIRRVLAPNPSPLTGPGTNSYIIGTGRVALVDPGPDDARHLAALLGALGPGESVDLIVVTHAHHDHSALARQAARATGAPVLAFGDALAGRNPAFAGLTGLGGGEGLDLGFVPDALLADGDILEGQDWRLEVLHTPGHLGNHISLATGDTILCGDTAMGWATSIVSPPDGDMTAYMTSLRRLRDRAPARLLPGHGLPVDAAVARLEELLAHRSMRERQVLEALHQESASAGALARRIYHDTPPSLLPAATRNVLAHLLDLGSRNLVTTDPTVSESGLWTAL